MALHRIDAGGKVALAYDDATGEKGFMLKMTNKTGAATVKGSCVCASTTTDNAFTLQEVELDTFGVVYEAGIADGSDAWIWVNGSVAQVLFKDGESATREYVALGADTDGRALCISVPTGNPMVNDHFKEIGHVLETKTSGTNLLVLVHLHFN